MELEQLKSFFRDSPTMRLLCADSPAYVLDFLHQTFKHTSAGGWIAYAQDDLRLRLLLYQENLLQLRTRFQLRSLSPSHRATKEWPTRTSVGRLLILTHSNAAFLCVFIVCSRRPSRLLVEG